MLRVKKSRLIRISVLASGVLILSGCSVGIPNPDDAKACEELSSVLTGKLESLPTGGFDAVKLSTSIQDTVLPLAPEGFQPNINRVVAALSEDPLSTAEITSAGSEIAIRCALVGVNLEFPNPADLLLG